MSQDFVLSIWNYPVEEMNLFSFTGRKTEYVKFFITYRCPAESRIKMKMCYFVHLASVRKKMVGITSEMKAISTEKLHEGIFGKFGVELAKAD